MNSVDPRIDTLRQAARTKSEAATARAEAALRKLTRAKTPISFRAVATTAGVSTDFLYRHPELRSRIEGLRAQQGRARPRPPTTIDEDASEPNVVRTLTARLAETRQELANTKAELAAAHGELLLLRRTLQTANLPLDREDHDTSSSASQKSSPPRRRRGLGVCH